MFLLYHNFLEKAIPIFNFLNVLFKSTKTLFLPVKKKKAAIQCDFLNPYNLFQSSTSSNNGSSKNSLSVIPKVATI